LFLIFSAFFLYQAGGLGITAGAHRLWSHRSYKAKWPLKVILVIFNTLAFQVSPRYTSQKFGLVKTPSYSKPSSFLDDILTQLQFLPQNHVYEWVRDHRVHHKYSETDADPHNAKRGFFFSHVGWLVCRKHPMVIEKGSGISLKDLEEDKIVMFQKK
jgi:stearoyl-CoA desaturase (Delta-9 desaturase)